MLQNPKPEKAASRLHLSKKAAFLNQNSSPCQQQHCGFASLSSESFEIFLTSISLTIQKNVETYS